MIGVTINPMDPEDFDLPIFNKLVRTHPTHIVPRGLYEITVDNIEYSVQLTHSLFKIFGRHGLSQLVVLKNDPVNPFELSAYYESLGLINVSDFKFHPHEEQIPLWLKVIENTDELQDNYVTSEFQYMSKNLAMKGVALTMDLNNYYLRMFKPKGRSLFQILIDDQSGTGVLSRDERLCLTTAVLCAFRNQVLSQGILHNFLIPENLFVDLETMKVTIINYVDAMDFGTDAFAFNFKGTNPNFAPEFLAGNPLNGKSDFYALGIILAKIWGDRLIEAIPDKVSFAEKHLQSLNDREWIGLFDNMSIPADLEDKVAEFIDSFVQIEPEHRTSFQLAYNNWQIILRAFAGRFTPEELNQFSFWSWRKSAFTSLANIYAHQEPPFKGEPTYEPLRRCSY